MRTEPGAGGQPLTPLRLGRAGAKGPGLPPEHGGCLCPRRERLTWEPCPPPPPPPPAGAGSGGESCPPVAAGRTARRPRSPAARAPPAGPSGPAPAAAGPGSEAASPEVLGSSSAPLVVCAAAVSGKKGGEGSRKTGPALSPFT